MLGLGFWDHKLTRLPVSECPIRHKETGAIKPIVRDHNHRSSTFAANFFITFGMFSAEVGFINNMSFSDGVALEPLVHW